MFGTYVDQPVDGHDNMTIASRNGKTKILPVLTGHCWCRLKNNQRKSASLEFKDGNLSLIDR